VNGTTALADAVAEMLHDAIWHQELGVFGPSIAALGETHLLLAKWLAMGRAGVLFVRSPIADMAVDNNKRRCVMRATEALDHLREAFRIVGVADPPHIPAIGEKARRDVFAESEIGMALYRHPIVIVNPTQIAQLLVTGERGRLARYALHHVAVAADRINVVVEHRKARPVEMLGQPATGERHADAVAASLTQRARRCFDARGQVIFGMTRAFAAEFAELPDVVECH
jgi:hypothetical protein